LEKETISEAKEKMTALPQLKVSPFTSLVGTANFICGRLPISQICRQKTDASGKYLCNNRMNPKSKGRQDIFCRPFLIKG
jgi:hypothetical protein